MLRLAAAVLAAAVLAAAVLAAAVPSTHNVAQDESSRVANVPYHRQLNDYACACGSVEMLLHALGPDVDQRAIINVMRTSPYVGTLSYAAHSSSSSSSSNTQLTRV